MTGNSQGSPAANVLRPWVERIKEAERQDAEYGLYIPGDSSLAVVFNAMEESAYAVDFTLAQPSHVSAESPCMDSGHGESSKSEGVEYGYDGRGTADGAAASGERLEPCEDRPRAVESPPPQLSLGDQELLAELRQYLADEGWVSYLRALDSLLRGERDA